MGILSDAMYLQVYTVGPDYAHAEARKSPALDGKVERDSEGKEIRYPVMLTAMEKLVARKVCVAFKVKVCGGEGCCVMKEMDRSRGLGGENGSIVLMLPFCSACSKQCVVLTFFVPTVIPLYVMSMASVLSRIR